MANKERWTISIETVQDTWAASEAINKYCNKNNCTPVQVSIAYNSRAIGGGIECIAIVEKND